jgi:hypothetical protein
MKANALFRKAGRVTVLIVAGIILAGMAALCYAGEGHIDYKMMPKIKVYRDIIESSGFKTAQPNPGEEPVPVLIRGKVLSYGGVGMSEHGYCESFIYINNQAAVGEDVVVGFDPDVVATVLESALTNDYAIQAWGLQVGVPSEYAGVTTKAYIITAARIFSPDVPPEYKELNMFQDFPKKVVQLK